MPEFRFVAVVAGLAAPVIALVAMSAALADPLPDANEMRESVVYIEAKLDEGIASGTGFIINGHGVIGTNNHVIENAQELRVSFMAGGKPITVPARVIDANPEKDIAIIQAVGDIFGEPVTLGNYDTSPTMKVTAVGYPAAANIPVDEQVSAILTPSYSAGTVGRILPAVASRGGETLIQTTAVINHGNSGGPLFDECGRVIGINSLGVDPSEGNQYAQGLFWAIDIRTLLPMLEANLIDGRIATKPCAEGVDARNDVPPAATKEAEAVAFDRFAACVNARPCDADVCKARYGRRVSLDLATARQSDLDLRMAAAGPSCTRQTEASAYDEFASCAESNPCDFQDTCAPKLQQSLRPEIMQKRQVLFDRARDQAAEQCRQASAPGVWHTAQVGPIFLARVYNPSKAYISITCVVDGDNSGNGLLQLVGVKGNRERWTGTRNVRMTIDSLTEPLALELGADGDSLTADFSYDEAQNDVGTFKELLGKLAIGGTVSFESPRIGLDETFSLNGTRDALVPCLQAKLAARHEGADQETTKQE